MARLTRTEYFLRASMKVATLSATLVFITWVVGLPIRAQTTFGTIVGTIRDSADSLMSGVRVTVTNEGTNDSKQTVTDGRGGYEVTHLNPGLYTVAAEMNGFSRHVSQHVTLETGQTLQVDIGMQVGQVTESLTVTGEAPMIETETGTLSALQTGREMTELPNSPAVRGNAFSGGIYFMVGLSPGNIRFEGTSRHTFNGTRGTQGNFMLDGTQLGDQRGVQISSAQPSFETIAEMKVVGSDNSAEYPNVASVIITSKSGTNQFHGSGFEQYNSGDMNSRNFFASATPFRVYNAFGGSIGGPVLLPRYNGHDRTFFFGAYEGNRDHGQAVFNSSVPSLLLRQGDFSQLFDSKGNLTVIKDPSTGLPFPGNVIPASSLSAVSLRTQQKFYPSPNFGPPTLLTQNFRGTESSPTRWDHFDFRLDHRFNDKNSAFSRFTWRNMPYDTADGNFPNVGHLVRLRKIRNMTLVDTHVFSPRVVNEVRAGFAWHNLPYHGPQLGESVAQELGIQGLTTVDPTLYLVPQFTINGFSQLTQIVFENNTHMVYDYIDNVTVIAGGHSLKIGFNHRRNLDANLVTNNSVFGSYTFTGTFSGNAYADFLLGIPQQTVRTTPQPRQYSRNRVYASYIQDSWRVNPNLTVNLGLRYEYETPFNEINGQMYNFDPTTGSIVLPTQAALRNVSSLFPKGIGIETAQQAGFPSSGLRNGDNKDFGPRVGVAWRPFGKANSVIRAGYGIYTNVLSAATVTPLTTGGPFITDETFVNKIVNGAPLFQFPQPFLAVGSAGTINIAGERPSIVNPYTQQWNVTLEHEFAGMGLRASYIGTRSDKLLYQFNLNQPLPSVTPFNTNRLPYPQFGNVIMVDNGGNSMYNALQIEAQRKFAKGFSYQASWTWAKNLSDGAGTEELGAQIANAFDRKSEWGNDDYSIKHRVVATFIWETPLGYGRKWLSNGLAGRVIGGWNLSGVVLLQTGLHFTPIYSGRDPANVNLVSCGLNGSATVVTGGCRPDRIGSGNLSNPTVSHWFDVNAFVLPPLNAGRFGNSGNGILEGPGTSVVSLSLSKNFNLTEHVVTSLTVSSTNLFNHPNFANPNLNISAAGAGQITALQGMDVASPRLVIVEARIRF